MSNRRNHRPLPGESAQDYVRRMGVDVLCPRELGSRWLGDVAEAINRDVGDKVWPACKLRTGDALDAV